MVGESRGMAPEPGGKPRRDEEGRIGPFPSWSWVYATVLIYGVLMILALWVLTRILDPGMAP